MKRVCEPSTDRITNLPAEVIQQILMLLPIKDAVKTATLSTKWSRRWRSIPQLVFDDDFPIRTDGSGKSSEKVTNKLLFTVYKALLLHDGPITKFVLSVPGLWPRCHSEIDQIILYLSDKGLHELYLFFPPAGNRVFKLHSALFSCLHLELLSLRSCQFRQPSSFVGFGKLTMLYLKEVTLPTDFFLNFLLKCPMLKILSIMGCTGTPSNLEIVTPCLEEFFLLGDFQTICFKCTPLLKTVSIFKQYRNLGKPSDRMASFASLPALQRFSADYDLLECLVAGDNNIPTWLPNPLCQLSFLSICRLQLGSLSNVRAFVCLIMTFPNLCELKIELDTVKLNQPAIDAIPSIGTFLEAEHHGGSGCCLQSLKVFEIKVTHGIQVELDLVRFILVTAPVLEKVHMIPVDKLEPRKAFEFMKKVMQYKRVSKEAELIYAGTYRG